MGGAVGVQTTDPFIKGKKAKNPKRKKEKKKRKRKKEKKGNVKTVRTLDSLVCIFKNTSAMHSVVLLWITGL